MRTALVCLLASLVVPCALEAAPASKPDRVDDVPRLVGVEYRSVEVRSFPDIASTKGSACSAVVVVAWAEPAGDAAATATMDRIAAAWRAFPVANPVKVEVYLLAPAWKATTEDVAWTNVIRRPVNPLAWYARRFYAAWPKPVISEDDMKRLEGEGIVDPASARAGAWGASKPYFQDWAKTPGGPPPGVR